MAMKAPNGGLALVAAATLALAATSVAAQANCATYGKLTLRQAQENAQRNCGFEGPAWSKDLSAHIKWCSSVGPDQWKAELKKRADMLANQCK